MKILYYYYNISYSLHKFGKMFLMAVDALLKLRKESSWLWPGHKLCSKELN